MIYMSHGRRANQPLEIPTVGFGGEACLRELTPSTVELVAPAATAGVVERSGHWMAEEGPDVIIKQVRALTGAA